jgi:hypothetical protein
MPVVSGEHWTPASIDNGPTLPGVPFRDYIARGGPQGPIGSTVEIRVTLADGSGATFILEEKGVPVTAPI